MRLIGPALVAAVWILGLVSPRRGGLSQEYVTQLTALLAALAALELTAPREDAPVWRRLGWLAGELALCFFVVRLQGTLVRPALVYLVPAVQAPQMFGGRVGLAVSLSVWAAYLLNIRVSEGWPPHIQQESSYLVFLLAPYVAALALIHTALSQAAGRRRVQGLYDELHTAHEQLQALHRRAREAAVAEERNRLAREIHDTLAHYLTVINLQLEAAEKLGDAPGRAGEQVQRARRLTLECLQEVRRSVAALRASTLDELSLPAALERLVAEFARGTGIDVQLELRIAEDERLPPEVALALYRVAQEGLTNVHRHARAGHVRIALARHGGEFELVVQDDGVGPERADTNGEGGFGLLGLRERVELLGGRLGFGSGPSGGGRLAVTLPAEGAA